MSEAAPITEDDFLGGSLSIRQPARGFRAGLDAVLLAASIPAAADRPLYVLDAGAGVGTAGLCLAARVPAAHVTLLEIAPPLAALARQNVELNGLAARTRVVEADLRAPAAERTARGLPAEGFDEAIANPPYLDDAQHRLPHDPIAARAFGMDEAGLDDWLRFLAWALRPGGFATLIHRADRLGELLAAMAGRFGGIAVVPIHPREGEPASRILVRGRKASRAPLVIRAGLVLHGAGNAFLPPIAAVLRDGAALDAFD